MTEKEPCFHYFWDYGHFMKTYNDTFEEYINAASLKDQNNLQVNDAITYYMHNKSASGFEVWRIQLDQNPTNMSAILFPDGEDGNSHAFNL